ncbi:hypothetical protein [Cohaesibacter celericrescens]|uniref:Conjugal transfer protein TrbL n=1 Tax=Cohaesibacter celericrescens TaxID=2067669 RepID=A0A2N5XRS0_9HYPH|nr:hypothetical protein [Cohaesibacter celericrescens]PLW77184.1 hypothetical protein C0081_10955 [Cohaesibacter celericrescens]
MSCITCAVFDAYIANSSDFMDQMVANVQAPLLTLMIAIAGAWTVWIGLKVVLGSIDTGSAIRQMVLMVLGFGALAGSQALIGEVFDTAISVMGGLSSSITGYGGDGASSMGAVLETVETAIIKVFVIVGTFIGDAGWTEMPARLLYGIALILPYGILLVLFLSHTAVSLFRITLIGGLSPFIIAISSFPFGRDVFAAGIRTIISAISTMLSITVVFSIVVKSLDVLQVGGDSAVSPDEFGSLTSGPYLLALMMGWLGSALLSEAVAISGTIGGALLGSVGAGIVSGGTMAAGGMAARAGMDAGSKVYGKIKSRLPTGPNPPTTRAGEISSSDK